eukprot:gene33380-41193_t
MDFSNTAYNLSWLITTVPQMTFVSILITLVTTSSVFSRCSCRAKAASLLGPMIFFASFFPYYAVNDPQFNSSSKTATCILAPACFALGANVFADYEGGLVGVRSSNAGQETSNFTYNACVGMMFFDAYFPLLPSYWFGVKMCDTTDKNSKDNFFTRTMVPLGVSSFRSYSHVSVHGEDEKIEAQRVDLERGLPSEDMQTIRRNLGLYPHHDIQFPQPTSMHLQIYAALKATVNAEQLAFVSQHITELVKRFVPVGELLSDNQVHLNIAEYGISVTTVEELEGLDETAEKNNLYEEESADCCKMDCRSTESMRCVVRVKVFVERIVYAGSEQAVSSQMF